jgi:GDPmannose 4,6-dehydratase
MAQAVAKVKLGLSGHVEVGDLDLTRDWGHADDGVRFMWMSLQHERPDDYVVATGNGHTPRDFTTHAFKCLGIELRYASIPYLQTSC